MNDRIFLHWKSSCGGLLAVAGIIFSAIAQNYGPTKWVLTASAVVAGLTGLLAKD